MSQERSPRELGLALKSRWQPGAALVGVQLYSQGLSFYSGQVFHLMGCRTELDFGRAPGAGAGLMSGRQGGVAGLYRGPPGDLLFPEGDDLAWLSRRVAGEIPPGGRA